MHFLTSETVEAIASYKKSKVMDQMTISNLHLKILGGYCCKYLTEIFNLSLVECKLPTKHMKNLEFHPFIENW